MKAVTYTRDAAKALRRHSNIASRVRGAIEAYAENPLAHVNNVKPLVGGEGKRLRVGGFRVIFAETETTILVTKVAPRGDAYQ